MHLTTRGRYGIQALLDLVNHSSGRPVKLQDIADRQKLPIFYLEQIFRQLRIQEVVASVRGPGGGYVLNKPLPDITVRMVLDVLGETTSFIPIIENPAELDTVEYKHILVYLGEYEKAALSLLDKSLEELLNGHF